MKRGFTLAELLGVTVLLALIMAVSYPALFKIFEDKTTQIDSNKKEIIESAAINYVKLNINEYPYTEGKNTCLFLKTLVDNNKVSDTISEGLEDRIIRISMYNNKYSAEILDSNETCTSSSIVYNIKTCTQTITNDNYKIIDNRTDYIIDGNVQKQVDIIKGENINDLNQFKTEMANYDTLSDVLNKNTNIISVMNRKEKSFEMSIEMSSLNEIILTDIEKSALTNAPIFYDTSTSKIKICE